MFGVLLIVIGLTVIPSRSPARKEDGTESYRDKDGCQYDHDCRDDDSRHCKAWRVDEVGLDPHRRIARGGLGEVGPWRNLIHVVWQRFVVLEGRSDAGRSGCCDNRAASQKKEGSKVANSCQLFREAAALTSSHGGMKDGQEHNKSEDAFNNMRQQGQLR